MTKVNAVMLVSGMVVAVLLTSSALSHAAPASAVPKTTGGKDFGSSQIQDEEQQLETLKSQGKNGVSVVKSQMEAVSNVNGHEASVGEKETTVQDLGTGQTLAQIKQETVKTDKGKAGKTDQMVKTEVNIPSKNIHTTDITRNGKPLQISDSKELNVDDYIPFEGIQYTPADFAEYIFRTGDGDGVALAIEELMREKLLSQDDATSYLEEVKIDLEMLRNQREKAKLMREVAAHRAALANQESREEKLRERASLWSLANAQMSQDSLESQSEEKRILPINFQPSALESKRQFRQNANNHRRKGSLEDDIFEANVNQDVNYDDMVEKVRLADFLSKELSFEEVIYQLAKQMFMQSVLRANSDAEESLQRLVTFLKQETARGRISPEMQRKVIDVLAAALYDMIGEHPELGMVQPPSMHAESMSDLGNGNSSGRPIQSKEDILKNKTGKEAQLTQEKGFGERGSMMTNTNSQTKSTAKDALAA